MFQNFLNDIRILNTRKDLHLAAALVALLDVYCEHTFQSLRPRLAIA